MAIGTILITFVPGYETIGIIAPILVVIGRLLQGFSAGVESGGVSIYLAEIATDKNRGFITSWQSGSQQVAVVFAALLGYWLNTILTTAQVGEWGWRIPFLIGCLIIPLIFLFRRTLEETEAFKSQKTHPSTKEIQVKDTIRNAKSEMLKSKEGDSPFKDSFIPSFAKQ